MQPYEEEYGRRYREEEEEFGAEGRREERVSESLESPFDEEEEVQLATELLGVTSEEELEEFLGKWLRAAARKAGGFLGSATGKAVGGILKNVAKQALPAIGGALGTAIGGPGIGTAFGAKAGDFVSNLFEVEGEGIDHEEYEFETARRFVALSGAAARNAASGSRRIAPRALAQQAVHSAARRYAPGVARRFRTFAVPAAWFWPGPPVSVPVEEPAGAPAAPAAKEEWGASPALEEWRHGEERREEGRREEQREEWGNGEERREERREFGEERREATREFGEERGWEHAEEEEEERGRAEEERRAREEGWGHEERTHHEGHHEGHHNGRARSGRWVRQGRKIVIMGA
ncbi:hypothetical protein OH768_20110 [Streptomyces sp. NBC_01622]|uniref:hypothetical protein n=1 Tax=Streptomyces sp. NBC_01622 TaxID=2975903 RepID=UPI003870EC1A|nr:hypothetical protein OH768_20110 [Streptomyces sp. NBC_01622]